MQIGKNATGVAANAPRDGLTTSKRRFLAVLFALSLFALAAAAKAGAQLPDAPSASEVAPLKRYSFNVGLDNKYSLTTSLYDIAPHLGLSVRLGERETLGVSYARSMVINNQHVQSNAVGVSATFRVISWGKIPTDR